MFKSQSKNPTTQTIFYIFEVCAAIVAVIYFVAAIYLWVDNYGFLTGLTYIASGIFYGLVLFGLGKIIDGRPEKHCCKRPPEDAEEKSEDEE